MGGERALPRTKNPFLHYLLLAASGGLYGFLWLYSLSVDVDKIRGRQSGYPAFYAALVLPLLAVHLAGVGYSFVALSSGRPFGNPQIVGMLIVVLALVTALIATTVRAHLRLLEAVNITPRFSDVLFIVFLSVCWFFALPYLQSKVNALITGARRPFPT